MSELELAWSLAKNDFIYLFLGGGEGVVIPYYLSRMMVYINFMNLQSCKSNNEKKMRMKIIE
jgi:hypothetical protein